MHNASSCDDGYGQKVNQHKTEVLTFDMVTKAGRLVVDRQARARTGWDVAPLASAVAVATSQMTTFCSGSLPADRSHMELAEKLRA